jgi:flagellar export protein FliJ
MQAFRFNLEKVLQLRETQLEVEEVRFKQQVAAVGALERELLDLDAAVAGAEMEVRRTNGMQGRDLAALASYRSGMQKRKQEVSARRQQSKMALEKQQAIMLEARRRCRLLERLRDRRRKEWQAACDRELEEGAQESFLAGWARGQRQADAP